MPSVYIVTGTPFPVTFNNGTNTFTIAGGDFTGMFITNQIITALGGPPNGGYQKVVSSVYSGGNTVVTVNPYSIGTIYPGPATFTTGGGTVIWFSNIAAPVATWSLQVNFEGNDGNSINNMVLGTGTNAIAFGQSQSYSTTNGGTSWTPITLPSGTVFVFSTGFSNTFFASTGGSTGINNLYYSNNVGVTWTNIPITGYSGSSEIIPYVVTATGDIFLTQNITIPSNSGKVNLWKIPYGSTTVTQYITNGFGPSSYSGQSSLYGQGFVANASGSILVSMNSYLANGNSQFYKSTNGGTTWTVETATANYELISFLDFNGTIFNATGYNSVTNKVVNYTSTDGATWTLKNSVSSGTPPYINYLEHLVVQF